MKHGYSMRYRRVELRPLTAETAEQMRVLRNARRDCFVNSGEISTEAQEKWFQNYLKKPNDYMFAVFHVRTGKWIGAVSIYDVDVSGGQAEFGRLLIDKTLVNESGLGADTTVCACRIAFSMLDIQRVVLEVYADNAPAVHTYLHSGFRQYGEISDNNGRKLIQMELSRKDCLAMSTIQVLKPKFHVDECLAQIRECLEKGWTGSGFKTAEFEAKWKEYTGHKNACYLNSNTSGLHLAVNILKRRYGWQDGDEIISSPITFVSTNHAIMYENMKPCFADVDEYLCIDPADVERKINARTRAVAFVGYGGRVGQLDKIIEICKKHGLRLILDAAHMAGTRVNGVFPGTWDGVDVAVYSYQAVKNLPTGDSGMICFADDALDAECRMVSWMGINKDTYSRTSSEGTYKWNYGVDYLGYKYNGNAIMASIALAQLPYLDEENAYRRKLCAIYDEAFAGNPNIRVIGAPYKDECAYHIYEIVVPDREALLAELAKHDVYCGVHYRDNTEFSMYTYAQGTCPVAHEVTKHNITMPLHMYLSESDVRMIAGLVNDFVK